MTRVYQANASPGVRVLVVGAGSYPTGQANVPQFELDDLSSVPMNAWAMVQRLLQPWFGSLAAPLASIDLLLNDGASPAGVVWPGYGQVGEVAVGTPIDPPTLANITTALSALDAGAVPADTLLVVFCGHGFFRGTRYFLPCDFGGDMNVWTKAIDLDALSAGLKQFKARTQWVFWDCCANIPQAALSAFGNIGQDLIGVDAVKLVAANALGPLVCFCMASSSVGLVAYGVQGALSRFIEMVIEALDGVGATRRRGGQWWVEDLGIMSAMRTYVQRHCDLPDPAFYTYVAPVESSVVTSMRFRVLAAPPTSSLVTRSSPRADILDATLQIAEKGAAAGAFFFNGPQPTAACCHQLPAQQYFEVSALFPGQPLKTVSDVFADLPAAEDVEFTNP